MRSSLEKSLPCFYKSCNSSYNRVSDETSKNGEQSSTVCLSFWFLLPQSTGDSSPSKQSLHFSSSTDFASHQLEGTGTFRQPAHRLLRTGNLVDRLTTPRCGVQ